MSYIMCDYENKIFAGKKRSKNHNYKRHHRRKTRYRSRKNKLDGSGSYSSDENDSEAGRAPNDFLDFGREKIYAEENHIYFRGTITESSIEDLVRLIREKNSEYENLKNDNSRSVAQMEPAPLYLHITSYGGCLHSTLRAIDAIQNSKIPINTVIDGHAASGGTLMSIVGVNRYMTPHAKMLIHQLSSGVCGKYNELEDDFNNCKESMDEIVDLYFEKTKLSKKKIRQYLNHDSWWRYDKCKEVGLVDGKWPLDSL